MNQARQLFLVALLTIIGGCSKWSAEKAPVGFAVIREHVVFSPGNDPPIHSSKLDYTLIQVDGKPITRETLPALVHMQRGALVSAGTHEFKALVSPRGRRPNNQPAEVTFTADVQSTKVYYLVDKDNQPTLIEVKARRP